MTSRPVAMEGHCFFSIIYFIRLYIINANFSAFMHHTPLKEISHSWLRTSELEHGEYLPTDENFEGVFPSSGRKMMLDMMQPLIGRFTATKADAKLQKRFFQHAVQQMQSNFMLHQREKLLYFTLHNFALVTELKIQQQLRETSQ